MPQTHKILIVDDDENIAELVSLYLKKELFDTEIAYDGEAALKAVEEYKPDLIVLDIMLPGIDGYEVCREIRKTLNTPIIMLSAKGETFDKVLALELGADDYMVKPLETKEFIARVKALLRRSANFNADQKKKEKQHQALVNAVAVGDSILTTSGFYGVVIDMTDEVVIVEFGSNKNCRIPMQKSAIVEVDKAEEA